MSGNIPTTIPENEFVVTSSERDKEAKGVVLQAGSISINAFRGSQEGQKQQYIATIEETYKQLLDSPEVRDARGDGLRCQIDMQRELAIDIVSMGDETARNDVVEMFRSGKLRGIQPTETLGLKGFVSDDLKPLFVNRKLTKLMHIYKVDPDAAVAITENHVAGFHGSRSSMLYSFLEHGGLVTGAEARKRGLNPASGERRYSPDGGQTDVSFADWSETQSVKRYTGVSEPKTIEDLQKTIDDWKAYIDVSYDGKPVLPEVQRKVETIITDNERQLKFVQENPNSPVAGLILEDFPIAFGIDISEYPVVPGAWDRETGKELRGVLNPVTGGDIEGEFSIHDDFIPQEKLPVVAVPSGKIEEVQAMFVASGKKVKVMDIAPLRSYARLADRIRRSGSNLR